MMAKLADLYGGGMTGKMLRGRFRDAWGNPNQRVRELLNRYHLNDSGVDEEGYYRSGEHKWKVPTGLLYYWRKPLRLNQMVVYHPWYATWRSPKSGKRLKKMFSSLPQAVEFITTKAQYVDPKACIVSKQGYDVPPMFRGKFPRKHGGHTYYWCPLCIAPRPFFAAIPQNEFHTLKKVWVGDHYEYKDRKLRVIKCRVCGCSNRLRVWRRSNQPWQVRKFKKGARRASRRRSTRR